MAQPSLPKRFGTPLELSGEDRGSDLSPPTGNERERERMHVLERNEGGKSKGNLLTLVYIEHVHYINVCMSEVIKF